MSLGKIVLRHIAERKLSSTLTTLSIALGVAVTVALLAIQQQSRDSFGQSAFGYDLIVGARGSSLQLVLNTVYHLDVSPGNIPDSLQRELAQDRRVMLAIPVAVGDHYRGFRIMGTSEALFQEFEYQPGRKFEIDGRPFGRSEAVIGSTVARRTGLAKGATFSASHGVTEGVNPEIHEEKWTVAGILHETGTPADRAIYIPLENFLAIEGHTRCGEISALIVKTRGEFAALSLQSDLNRRTDVMAVVPAEVIGEFFDKIGQADILLLAVSILVIVVAGVSILVSIYNSMNERRRSIAIMRALGAHRRTILAVIILEALFLCLAGGILGIAGGHAMTGLAGSMLQSAAGISLSPWVFHLHELAVLGGLLGLGSAIGLVPALKAYRTDIAEGLSPTHG